MHLLSLALLALVAPVLSQTIDPSTVPLSTKENWCTLQTSTCPLLCPQIGGSLVPLSNTCNSTTLAFTCICSNNQSPNSSQYTQTIPYFECTTANDQCAAQCANGDSACVSECRTGHPCGAQDPPKGNHTHTSTAPTAASTAASTVAATGFGGPTSGAEGHMPMQVLSTFAVVTALGLLSEVLL